MKCVLLFAAALGSKVTPIEKTLELLAGLQAKIVKEGETAQKLYEEFTDYCDDNSKELIFSIKTGKAEAERQTAAIAHAAAKIQEAESVIEDLAAKSSTNSADLKAATEIRDAEKAEFEKSDADLGETVDMLRRAISIIEREMNKGSSLVQTDMSAITDALQSLLNANTVNSMNKAKVQALLQSQTDMDDLQPAGAPAPDAYKSHSGGILATLEDMMEKAAAQRADGQKAEMVAQHNFELLAQKLNDEIADQEKQLKATKKAKAVAEEAKSEAEGALAQAQKGVAEDESALHDLQENCMVKATAYDVEKQERAGELNALATAMKILQEKTGGASERTYSFLQVKVSSRVAAKAQELESRLLAFVQKLAKTDGTEELAQLLVRIKTTMGQAELDGDDPFAKVKGLIQDMIEKLVAEAQKEASHKAFCDEEMSETKAKKEDKEDELDTLGTKIDQATAKIAKLKEEVATLEKELAEIAKVQAEADKLRADEKAAWADAKADFEGGLEGVRMALDVLRDYYAEKGDEEALLQQPTGHTKATGAASGIIGMLEVIESDFSKMLAEGSAKEDQAQGEYEKLTKDNEVATATKTTEVKYKTKDSKETAARLAGLEDDKGVAEKEYSAIMEYWEKLQPMCVAKPEPYEERKKRREAEIAGLKEALQILENESAPAFLQIRRA